MFHQRERLIELLEKQSTPHQLWQQVFRCLADEGFDRAIYLRGSPRDIKVASNFEASWNEHYVEQGFMERDPFLRYCATHYRTVRTGIDHVHEHPYLTPAEKQIINEASECGFRSGFSNTLQRFDGHQIRAWNIGSRLSGHEVTRLLDDKLPYLQLISYYAALFAGQFDELESESSTGSLGEYSHHNPNHERVSLTARERRCLALCASGMRTRDIADLLKRSEATIEFHLRNARDKLGARTREHAIFIAMKMGLL